MLAATLSGGFSIAGTMVGVAVAVASLTALTLRWNQGDPSDWRENYLGEVTKRQEVEAELAVQRELKHAALTEVATLKARTDLEPLVTAMSLLIQAQERSERRFTERWESIEKSQQQTAEILSQIVDHLRPAKAA